MTETTCAILLYAGKWSPRIHRSLKESLACALADATAVEIETDDNPGDGPRVTVTVTYGSGDSELVRDEVCESVVHYLRPQYESQVEVEIVNERHEPYDDTLDDDLFDYLFDDNDLLDDLFGFEIEEM